MVLHLISFKGKFPCDFCQTDIDDQSQIWCEIGAVKKLNQLIDLLPAWLLMGWEYSYLGDILSVWISISVTKSTALMLALGWYCMYGQQKHFQFTTFSDIMIVSWSDGLAILKVWWNFSLSTSEIEHWWQQ